MSADSSAEMNLKVGLTQHARAQRAEKFVMPLNFLALQVQ